MHHGRRYGERVQKIDVRLVPDFEAPLIGFVNPIAVHKLLRKGSHQFVTLCVVLQSFGGATFCLYQDG